MRVDRIRLEGFRNYVQAEAVFNPNVNVIAGANAQGKTNLLEAVWLLTGCRSFRARLDREMIGFGQPQARLEAELQAGGREQRVTLSLRAGQRRQFVRNGVKTRPSEMTGLLRAVLFCPEDLELLRAGPAVRRQFLDTMICQLIPAAKPLYQEFTRLYESKSRILRDWREKPSLLEPLEEYDEAMARASAGIIRYRASCALRLAELAAPIHREFSGGAEELTAQYQTVSTVTDPTASTQQIFTQVMEHQKNHRQAELAAGACLTGAHKDDLQICINGHPARAFASQGQTRTAALSLKLAERELHQRKTGEWPVLLLDDVLSELDAQRQEYVLNRVRGGQMLLTCCGGEEVSRRIGGTVLHIENGRIG